jgi:hypothetical protein
MADPYANAETRAAWIGVVKEVMADSHSSYFMRHEIRDDGGHDMAETVAAMFVDELILPAVIKAVEKGKVNISDG